MKLQPIKQQPVDFLAYEGRISYDETTNEIVIHPAKFKLFEHEIEWTEEERFTPEEGDKLYITDEGLVLVKDNSEVDFSQFQRYDLFGWVEKDYQSGELVFKYLIHPKPKEVEDNK